MRYTRLLALALLLPATFLVACSDRGPDSPLAPSSLQPRFDTTIQSDTTGRSGYTIGGNSTGDPTTTSDTTSTGRTGYTVGGN